MAVVIEGGDLQWPFPWQPHTHACGVGGCARESAWWVSPAFGYTPEVIPASIAVCMVLELSEDISQTRYRTTLYTRGMNQFITVHHWLIFSSVMDTVAATTERPLPSKPI